MIKFIRKNCKYLLLFLILFLGIYLRFYNLRKNVEFGWDQELAAFQIKTMIENKKPILIGPRIGPAKFFLPPFYYYINTPFLYLTKFDPIGLYYCSALLGIITAFLIYLCSLRLYNYKTGLIAFTIYLFSPLMVVYDRVPWNVNMLILASCTCYFSLLNMANNKITFWNSLLLGLGLGIAVNAHFTGVFLIIVSAIWLILNKKISKNLIISFLILLVFVSPLFLFDYRHNFFNYNSALDFFRGNKELIPISFSLKITRFIHNLSLSLELFGSLFIGKVSFWGKPILGIVGLMLIVFNLFKVNNFSKNKYKLFFLYLLSPCLLFVYYNGAIPEYYLFLLLPVFILATSDIVSKVIINKHFYTIAVLILTFVIIHDLNLVKSTSEDGLYNKKQIINRIKAQSVKLTYIMSMGQDVGYKYLLDLKKIKIDNNAETEAIIKFPILDDVRKSDYYLSGNIGIKLKDKSYDQNFIDYWNQNYKFAFDLPRDLTIISCDLVKSETLISDRNSGSCYLPYLDSKTKMLFITGEENKLYKIFNDFNGQEFNTSIISRNFIPGKRKIMNDNLVSYIFIIPNQNKSILFELQMENNDKMFEKFIHIIQSIRIYED